MHGDHCLGVHEILQERDHALSRKYCDSTAECPEQIYVCVPFMLESWVKDAVSECKFKNSVHVVHLNRLNPENEKYFNVPD